ncbi:MAG: polysaccharide biosynthesis tyrosine autokinase [Candidatus Eremiobacterota bacterium]
MNIEPYKNAPSQPQSNPTPVEAYKPSPIMPYKSEPKKDEEEIDWKKILSYLNIVRRRKFVIIQCMSIVLLLGFVLTKMTTPLYSATSKVVVLPRPIQVQRQGQEETTVFLPSISIEAQMQMMSSSAEVGENISKLLKEKNKINLPPGAIMGSLSFNKIKDTEIILINAINEDPELARLIANYGADQFKEKNRQFDSIKLKQSRDMVEQQLAMVEKDLKEAEEKFKNFQKKENLIDVDTEVQAQVKKVIDLESSKAQAQVEKDVAQAKLTEARSGLQGGMGIDEKDPVVTTLEGQLAALEIELAGLKEKWADDYPDVLNTKAKIEETKKKLREAMASQNTAEKNQMLINNSVEYTGADAKTSGLSALYEKESTNLKNLPEKIVEMKRLKRELDITEDKYKQLLQKSQQAKIMEADQQGNIEVAAYALTPFVPFKPNMKKNLSMALLLGLCLGIGMAILLEQLNIPLINEEDVSKNLNLSVMEVIPKIKFSNKFQAPSLINVDDKERKYVFFLEAFRTLRTVLNFSMKDDVSILGRNVKTMLVTSSVPGEGKSTVSGNLAISYAQMGKKVLLVEADLLRPTLYKAFNIELHNNGKGLTDFLTAGNLSLKQLIHNTDIPNLKILTAGKNIKFTSELFESDKMKEFIKDLVADKETDMVIFDSSPCQAVSDGIILSSMVDKVLLVVSTGMNARTVQQSIKMLNSAQADIAGVVLNKMETSRGTYYSYKYKYGYYYSRDRKTSEPKLDSSSSLDEILEGSDDSMPKLEKKEKDFVFKSDE